MHTGSDFHDMAARLEARFLEGGAEAWSEAELDAWAHRIFAHQYAACAPYRALCDRRGVTPHTVDSWEEIPPVPATAFKHFDLVSGPEPAEVVFRTSGTTRGTERRGRHHVPCLDLYRASLREPFRRALLADVELGGAAPMVFLSLIPSPEDAPRSSLSFMVGSAAAQLDAPVRWLVDGDGRWKGGAVAAARRMVDAAPGRPVLLLGTALSFVHLLERVEEADAGGAGTNDADGRGEGDGRRDGNGRGGEGGGRGSEGGSERVADAAAALPELMRSLPEGSRIMETGGFKGAERSVSREDLYAGLEALTGIPRQRTVNEYGMTELLSQLYEPVLSEGPRAAGSHVPAPWLRVRALDPTTLRPVPEGAEGILAFFDPANLGSISHVLTEDVGSVVEGRVRLRGRTPGAEPRGCSRAMDELMQAAARG